ncbi:MAG: hypothetical protein NUV64_02215 [Parcubacteria group bacterium]|nr:hypothetical protein [Parcubacteria group bacterium]MCR4342867.1 hypothetical protein [Patescibacteria group bacterium]
MNFKESKERAILLRKQGFSYSYISNETGVSKSTLSYWLTNIPYKPNKDTIARMGEGRLKSAIFKSNQKQKSISEAKKLAKDDIKDITDRDLFMLGIGLYIGEGAKTQNIIRIINADPNIINLSIGWFERICGLKKDNFSLAIHLYLDNNVEESLDYWSKITSIPRSQFGKTQIDQRLGKKISKRGKLPHGTAHLTIKSNGKKEFGVFLHRRIMAWIDEVYLKTNNAGII